MHNCYPNKIIAFGNIYLLKYENYSNIKVCNGVEMDVTVLNGRNGVEEDFHFLWYLNFVQYE